MPTCTLCDTPTDQLVATLGLCEGCRDAGDLTFPARGLRVAKRTHLDPDTPLDDGGTTVLRVLGRHPGLRAAFAREGLLASLWNLVAPDLKTGDTAFDRAVWIRTPDPDGTARLLTSEPVRALITHLVAHVDTVRLEPDAVVVELHHGPRALDAAPTQACAVWAAMLATACDRG